MNKQNYVFNKWNASYSAFLVSIFISSVDITVNFARTLYYISNIKSSVFAIDIFIECSVTVC